MTPIERIRLCRILELINKQPDFSKQINLVGDTKLCLGENVDGGDKDE